MAQFDPNLKAKLDELERELEVSSSIPISHCLSSASFVFLAALSGVRSKAVPAFRSTGPSRRMNAIEAWCFY